MSENQPRKYDVVLGGSNILPVNAAVLGGLEGVKRRLENPDIKVQIAALYQVLNYGEAGLDLVIQALYNHDKQVKVTAYSLLREREEARVIQTLEKYSTYQIFDCIETLEGNKSRVNTLCITPDGQTLFSGSEDGNLRIWDWRKKKFQEIFCFQTGIKYICLHPKAKTIFISSISDNIKELSYQNTNSQRIVKTQSYMGLHHSFTISPNGKYLFLGEGNNYVEVYDLRHNKSKLILRCCCSGCSLVISSNGKTLLIGNKNSGIEVWDWNNQKFLYRLGGDKRYDVSALCISPDGKTLFSGGEDGNIKVWYWQKLRLIRTFKGHFYGVNTLAISPDGKTLISGSGDKTIKVWDWQNGELQSTLTGHTGDVNSIVLSPDGQYIFSGSHDTTIKVWGLK
ncbi:MAG: WD40 repeat domain-containing protein [Nostocaceae cyanobacterium]|nr:WD40 repeat domain-containing protein [Nostocaceae cyanobacterium]